MEIAILTIGKTGVPYVRQGLDDYLRRLTHYASVKMYELADTRRGKSIPEAEQKQREGKMLLDAVKPSDYVVLLDERGRQYTSTAFSQWLQKKMSTGRKRLVLIIGGPYGFSQAVYDRADEMLSLSQMTFTHEMIRLFLAEQLYRSFTILRGEPYHHT